MLLRTMRIKKEMKNQKWMVLPSQKNLGITKSTSSYGLIPKCLSSHIVGRVTSSNMFFINIRKFAANG